MTDEPTNLEASPVDEGRIPPAGGETDLPTWELGEITERIVLLEEQTASQRTALAFLTVAVIIACTVAAAYALRSARGRA